jgi:hypothetical protein
VAATQRGRCDDRDLNKFPRGYVVARMDPAIFIEAEEARLSQCVADATETLRAGARRLARQHEILEELKGTGQQTMAAKHRLAALAAAHQLNENLYESLLQRLDRAVVDR